MGKYKVKPSDKEILLAVREGKDKEVIQSLYIEVLPNVEHYVCSNNGSKADAFDMFHDALLVFFRNVIEGSFDETKYKVHGYIFTVSKNLWINQAKRKGVIKKWEERQDLFIAEESYLDQLVREEKTAILDQLFKSLDKNCFRLLTLSIYEKLSMKEIAEKLGNMNESSAKVQCYRCRKKLSDLVKSNPSLVKILKN